MSRTGRKNGRRGNPKAVFLLCLVLTLGTGGTLIFVGTFGNAWASKSAYTQAHGLLRSGVVTSVTDYETKVPSSDVGVRLGEPVNGQATTTAHVKPITSLKPGAAVRVLVDPQDPGYAEFPGEQYTANSSILWAAAGLLACLAFLAFATIWWGRVWFRERRRMAES